MNDQGGASGALAGRVALVTGASRGVGAAIARRLAGDGARVALVARGAEALAAVAGECGGQDGALALAADVTDEEAVHSVVAATIERFGRLDALVLNAAVGLVGKVEDFSLADWRRTLDTNVTSAFLLCRVAIPHLRENRGAIVAIGSEFSRAGFPWLGAYAASKWALLGLMQSLAPELEPDGIKVSSILPGGILTDFGPDTVAQKLERRSRGEKFLEPEDVADAVGFLLAQPPRAWTQELHLWPRRVPDTEP